MSVRGPRCGKHPSHVLVGVCAFCLRERLAGLADVECTSDAHNSRKKKQSPGHPHAAHGSHKQSSVKRGDERPPSNLSVNPIAEKGLQNDPIPTMHSYAGTTKGLGKSLVAGTMVHSVIKQSNKFSISGTLPVTSSIKAHEAVSTRFAKSNEPRGSDANNSIHPPTILDMACNVSASAEMPAVRHSFSSTKRSSDSSKPHPPSVKTPILENGQQTVTDSRSDMHLLKHTSVGCSSPLLRIAEQAKRVSLVNQVHHAALSDSERNSFNAISGTRSLPFPETTVENVRDKEIVLSAASPTVNHKKKTLSSLFSLDDADFPSSKANAEESKSRLNAERDAVFNGSASATAQPTLQAKTMPRKCKHGSFSERVEPSTYLFPVPEAAANNKPLTWFSSLFRRRKKKAHPKSGVALGSFSEHNNGWQDARQSWEAPRLSSWEQFRFSSFEGPRSSWEPARPSWEGVMRASDDARRSLDSNRLGLKSKLLASKTPDDKDRAHSFLPAKATITQRDVSTQTTPPRASDATEIFIQQRLQRSRHRQHCAKASHAVWSKVWTKTFSNSKWAFKQKHHKERRPKEMGDAMMPLDEADEQGNMTSGRSSFHEVTNIANNHHSRVTCIDNIEEHEAWDTFDSPLQQGRDLMARLASNSDTCIQKDEQVVKARGSNWTIENGLLKFYLTPVRSHSKMN
ncbi:hypothetical protein GOP47_0030192 [Adiantum capillus-veneris]|nr:hypothetical protein GOP47_0030192 [Adiantum capillus-veneris]